MTPQQLQRRFGEWLEYRQVSKHTVLSYTTAVGSWLGWCADQHVNPTEAAGKHLERWAQGLQRSGLVAATVNVRLTGVREFYRWLRLDLEIDINDSLFEVKGMRTKKQLPKPAKQRVVLELIDSIDDTEVQGLRDKALISFIYVTGARIQEVCDLMCSDLNLEQGTARIEAGKGNKTRIVPVKGIEPLLERWITTGRPECYPLVNNLFLTMLGRGLQRRAAANAITSAATRAGLKDRISPHVLRHSCATHLVEAGAGIEAVSKLLGHESITTTMNYVKVSSNQIDQAHSLHPLRQGDNQ